jgi:glutathione S-transferase
MIPPLRITGRKASHFTRVARMVAHELALPYELAVVGDIFSRNLEEYGGHPALKIPTLHIGDSILFGTDNICRRLAELAGRDQDPRVVLPHQLTADFLRSAQELVWHAMAAQVQLALGVQVAKLPADSVYFAKATQGLHGTLAWLEEQLQRVLAALPAPRDLSIFEVTLFCLVEHIGFRPTVELVAYPGLRAFADDFGKRESARLTPFELVRY